MLFVEFNTIYPKRIQRALIDYNITAINSGATATNNNSAINSDVIPVQTFK